MGEPLPILFNTLPKDIIFDIFSRLSLKTLYQIKTVCKRWHLWLNLDPEFRIFYHQKHKISPILLFTQQIIENPLTKFSFHHIDCTKLAKFNTNITTPLNYILTSNGILCLISKSNVSLFDPITQRLTHVPNSSYHKSTFTFAFGNIVSKKTFKRTIFKLIHFYTIEKSDNYHYCQVKEVMCEIMSIPSYDLGLNSNTHQGNHHWKLLGKCPYEFLGRKCHASVDGKVYWLIGGDRKYNPEDCIKIMSFDLKSETFGVVWFSRSYSNRSVECLDLVEINGKLCLTDRGPWEDSMVIWMMNSGNNMWVSKYNVDLEKIYHHDVRILGHFGKFKDDYNNNNINDGFGEGEGEGEGEILIKLGDQSFGIYDLENNGFREIKKAEHIFMNVDNDGGEDDYQGWDLKLLLDRKLLL